MREALASKQCPIRWGSFPEGKNNLSTRLTTHLNQETWLKCLEFYLHTVWVGIALTLLIHMLGYCLPVIICHPAIQRCIWGILEAFFYNLHGNECTSTPPTRLQVSTIQPQFEYQWNIKILSKVLIIQYAFQTSVFFFFYCSTFSHLLTTFMRSHRAELTRIRKATECDHRWMRHFVSRLNCWFLWAYNWKFVQTLFWAIVTNCSRCTTERDKWVKDKSWS
jgi:hypothetical protein